MVLDSTKEDDETCEGITEGNQSSELSIVDAKTDHLHSDTGIQTAPDSTTSCKWSASSNPSRDVIGHSCFSEIPFVKPAGVVSSSSSLSKEQQAASPSTSMEHEELLVDKPCAPFLIADTNSHPVEVEVSQKEPTVEKIDTIDLRGEEDGVQSHTPPLPAMKNGFEEAEETETPKRYTYTKRTVLFDSKEQNSSELTQNKEMREDSEGECEADIVVYAEEGVSAFQTCSNLDETAENEPGDLNRCTSKDPDNRPGDSETETLKVTEDKPNVNSKNEFCQRFHSFVQGTTPDALSGLSTSEIFECHQELTRLMSDVVHVLRERCKSPK